MSEDKNTVLSRPVQFSSDYIQNTINSIRVKGQDKGHSFTNFQVLTKKRHGPSYKKIGNTTNDQDLWVLKEKVQSSVVGKDLTLESICASGICLRRISCIYSSHLYYMVKVLSCQFTEYRDKSKFMGNNWNNLETPPSC